MKRASFLACAILICASAPSHGSASGRTYATEHGVRLGPRMEETIARIAGEFHRRTGRVIVITSGTRSTMEQADAMFEKLVLGQRLTQLYRDYDAASEIQNAYRSNRARGREACVGAMARVLEGQLRRGLVISRHLDATAADVRSRDMSSRERRIFTEIVRAERGVELLQEGTPPHFHLQLDR